MLIINFVSVSPQWPPEFILFFLDKPV